MSFIRRIYYLKENGQFIFGYKQDRKLIIPSIEEDYKLYEKLQEFNLEQIGCLEWLTLNEEIESKLQDINYIYEIDISKEPHELIFIKLNDIKGDSY